MKNKKDFSTNNITIVLIDFRKFEIKETRGGNRQKQGQTMNCELNSNTAVG